MKKLYFVRHGLTEMNVSGHFSGVTETKLTDEGRKQAIAAGKAAKKLGIDLIISSPQIRAHDTAKIIAKEIGYSADKIKLNSLLVERDFGSLEGQTWDPDLDVDGIADVETVDSLLIRAALFLRYLETVQEDTILIAAHGSIGRAIRHHLNPEMPFVKRSAESGHKIPNAEIVRWI